MYVCYNYERSLEIFGFLRTIVKHIDMHYFTSGAFRAQKKQNVYAALSTIPSSYIYASDPRTGLRGTS